MDLNWEIYRMFRILVMTGVLFVIQLTFGQPVITGVDGSFKRNELVTISGSKFDTKPASGPVKWDDFEDGILGNNLSGWVIKSSHGTFPSYSNTILRTGSSLSVKCDFTGEQYNSSFGLDRTWPDYVYISYWSYVIDNGAVPPTNIKPYRIYGTYSDGNPVIGYTDQIESNWAYIWSHSENDVIRNLWNSVGSSPNDGKWHRYEFLLKQNSVGQKNGQYFFWKDAELKNAERDTVHRVAENDWYYLRIGHFWGGHDTGATGIIYYDDVYVDDSWARIEIGNNSNFNRCTHREIQYPESWSDNQISFRFNPGAFQNGQQVYLFVVNKNGNASDGLPVVVEGDYVRPSRVTGLKVTP